MGGILGQVLIQGSRDNLTRMRRDQRNLGVAFVQRYQSGFGPDFQPDPLRRLSRGYKSRG